MLPPSAVSLAASAQLHERLRPSDILLCVISIAAGTHAVQLEIRLILSDLKRDALGGQNGNREAKQLCRRRAKLANCCGGAHVHTPRTLCEGGTQLPHRTSRTNMKT